MLIATSKVSCFSVPGLKSFITPSLRRASAVSYSRPLVCQASSDAGDAPSATPSGLPPMPKFFSKWDDPNYDPTKDVVDTDVPLQIAAFNGDVGESSGLFSRTLSPALRKIWWPA